jgi:hypothetical protein
MIRRTFGAVSFAMAIATPLAAQAGMHHDDMDMKVVGGPLPAGWMGRTDDPKYKVEDAKFVTMGKGYHVTSGPAAIYWNDKSMVTGPFTASVTIRQTKNPTHPEGYGIFFQGRHLSDSAQNYAYFLVRADGKVLVNHRAGVEVHKIMEWTDNAGVHKADASGSATNTLTIDASRPDSIRLMVNGAPAAALPASHFGSVDGYVGVRVNHNLDVHISDFVIAPKK